MKQLIIIHLQLQLQYCRNNTLHQKFAGYMHGSPGKNAVYVQGMLHALYQQLQASEVCHVTCMESAKVKVRQRVHSSTVVKWLNTYLPGVDWGFGKLLRWKVVGYHSTYTKVEWSITWLSWATNLTKQTFLTITCQELNPGFLAWVASVLTTELQSPGNRQPSHNHTIP